MIKYKHKISGEIAEESPRFKNFYIVNHGHSLHKRFIENSNDWQKLEELDYEIISLKLTGGVILTFKDGKCIHRTDNENPDITFNLNRCLSTLSSRESINSVKRKSDGEVFTIGDVISNMCDSEQKISELYINKDGKMCVYTSTTCRFTIQNIKKVKTPLFTTEDGVEIFQGDNFTVLQLSSFTFIESCKHKPGNGFIAFSTKEKAEEYILLNKPCLSLNDLLSTWGNAEFPENSTLFNRFKKLAKSKL